MSTIKTTPTRSSKNQYDHQQSKRHEKLTVNESITTRGLSCTGSSYHSMMAYDGDMLKWFQMSHNINICLIFSCWNKRINVGNGFHFVKWLKDIFKLFPKFKPFGLKIVRRLICSCLVEKLLIPWYNGLDVVKWLKLFFNLFPHSKSFCPQMA